MSSSALDPETLARIAAKLNPQLACDDPARAIELARRLVIAADPELAEQEALRTEEIRLQKESERHDELFPPGELISIAEAFKASPGHYKTVTGFAAALRKKKLTTKIQSVDFAQWRKAEPGDNERFVEYYEVTSLRAVDELFKRQNRAKKARDRLRKAASKKKDKKNVAELQGEKAERIRRKAEPENKERKHQSKKRKPQKAR